jgi:SAM-dependent methyltransferase
MTIPARERSAGKPDIMRTPVAGAARNDKSFPRTFEVTISGIGKVARFHTGRLLDIGCGNGAFTIALGLPFDEVHGYDIEPGNIGAFRQTIGSSSKFYPHHASAAYLDFPDGYFDAVLSIETLEHVDDLQGVANECARVLRTGGELVLTVPNRWYPVEGHGGTLFGKNFSRLPLLGYFPCLHRRVAQARVFTVGSLDALFLPLGFERQALAYLWPTFEHGGGRLHARIQRVARRLYALMRFFENSSLRMFGSSIVVRYVRVARAPDAIPMKRSGHPR